MRALHRAHGSAQLATVFGIFASAYSAAAPTAADLARCAAIADPAARLACYDTISADKADGRPSAVPPAAPSAAAAPSSPAAPVATTAPSAPAFSGDPKDFGFTAAQRAPVASQSGPKAINARITKVVDTRWGQPYAVLDNGQTWVFVDSDQDAGLKPQDPITIKRGALGSFLLVTASHHSYHVRRVQ
jgi:hypothetical protein